MDFHITETCRFQIMFFLNWHYFIIHVAVYPIWGGPFTITISQHTSKKYKVPRPVTNGKTEEWTFFFPYSILAINNNFACHPWKTQSLFQNNPYNFDFQIVLLKVRGELCIVVIKVISINLVASESWLFIQTVTCFIRRFSPGTWRQHNYRTVAATWLEVRMSALLTLALYVSCCVCSPSGYTRLRVRFTSRRR